jgi:hypothetical protein
MNLFIYFISLTNSLCFLVYIGWFFYGSFRVQGKDKSFSFSFSFPKSVCFLGSHLIFPSDLESPKGEVIPSSSFLRKIVMQYDWTPFFFFGWLQTCINFFF